MQFRDIGQITNLRQFTNKYSRFKEISRRFTINIPDSLKYYAYHGSWVTRVRLVFLLFFSNNYCKKDIKKSLRGIQVAQFLLKCRRGCDICHAKLEISYTKLLIINKGELTQISLSVCVLNMY